MLFSRQVVDIKNRAIPGFIAPVWAGQASSAKPSIVPHLAECLLGAAPAAATKGGKNTLAGQD
jgi:hypothetical protein